MDLTIKAQDCSREEIMNKNDYRILKSEYKDNATLSWIRVTYIKRGAHKACFQIESTR